ncbi:MAG TPA: hypothetical protein PLA63_02740 [Tenuifilum sp.]|nr:hypothetical protein [Candidatus Dojkabacteria bacterium]HQI88277.1 hypothetical protein [Tenuifilum sp.]
MKNFIPQLDPELELKDVIIKLSQFDENFLNESFKNPSQFKQTIESIVKSLINVLENIQKDKKDDLQI